MQSFQHNNKISSLDSHLDSNKDQVSYSLVESSSFSPFLAKALKHPDNVSVDYVLISYCHKHNMIIACEISGALKLYDATTLLSLENRRTQNLYGFVPHMSYDHENESLLIGHKFGSLYTYNASSDELKELRKHEDFVTAFAFMDHPFYAFSTFASRKLSIGTLDSGRTVSIESNNASFVSLCYLPKRKLLLSSLSNGSLTIYRTNKLPCLQVFCSIQPHQPETLSLKVLNVQINVKEYVITSNRVDRKVKIWHLIKGRMRLLRVIKTEGTIDSFVYLENYKMLAIACEHPNGIGFFKLLSGKLERKFDLNKEPILGLFLMKDKNMIGGRGGFPGLSMDSIEFVQLHPQEN